MLADLFCDLFVSSQDESALHGHEAQQGYCLGTHLFQPKLRFDGSFCSNSQEVEWPSTEKSGLAFWKQ